MRRGVDFTDLVAFSGRYGTAFAALPAGPNSLAAGSNTAATGPTGSPPTSVNLAPFDGFPDSINLAVTIRDFHPYDVSDPNTIPDFQHDLNPSPITGSVLSDLGTDGTPTLNPSRTDTTIHSASTFYNWFHDVPGINDTTEIALPMTLKSVDTGMPIYRLEPTAPVYPDDPYPGANFLPINGRLFGNENSAGSTSANGNFTVEGHTSFTYHANPDNPPKFSYVEDDDFWIFINGKLALDLGSLHETQESCFVLDATKATELGLEDGGTYSFDFFHAERYWGWSHFNFETSIPFGGERSYQAKLTATDVDASDTLTWTVFEPRGATISPEQGLSPLESTLTYIPKESDVGTSVPFRVAVSDGHGGTDIREWTVDFEGNVDEPPAQVTALPSPEVTASGSAYSVDVSSAFDDPDSDPLTFLASGEVPLPDGMTLSAAGVLSWTPATSQEGKYAIDFVVSDGQGGHCNASFELYVVSPGGPSLDIDVFEDQDEDGENDNSSAAETAEQSGPVDIASADDEDLTELAVAVRGVATGSSITLTFDSTKLALFSDSWGQMPITSGTAIPLSDWGATGAGDFSVFAQLETGVTSVAANSSGILQADVDGAVPVSTGQLKGGASEGAAESEDDNVTWRDNDPDQVWADAEHQHHAVGTGGLDDGDGNQVLTDRDTFWDSGTPDTIMIGFAGHTQSDGFNTRTADNLGRIWNVDTTSGIWNLGLRVQTELKLPVTLFPEDPGNNHPISLRLCGDGVLGVENPFDEGARIDANRHKTGALAFIIDAVMFHDVKNIGLFGYSHGAGSIRILFQALAREAEANEFLRTALLDVKFFYSAYIDAVHIDLDNLGGGAFDATGTASPETHVPVEEMSYAYLNIIGSISFDNFFQSWLLPTPLRDFAPVHGASINLSQWTSYDREPDLFNEIDTEDGSAFSKARWPDGLDHTKRKGHGIAESNRLQDMIIGEIRFYWRQL